MNILLVTEEYGKLTKGLFRVWSTICARSSGENRTDVWVNCEHWLNSTDAPDLAGVDRVWTLPHPMPQTIATGATADIGLGPVAGVLRFCIRNFLALFFAPAVAIRLVWLARRRGIDRVICHHGGWPAGSFVRWVMLASPIAGPGRAVLVIHSFPSPYSRVFGVFQKAEERLIGRCAVEIVTVSQAAADALMQRNFGRQVRVIHNGLHTPAAAPPALLCGPEEPAVVGFLGALVPNKGAHVLLDAVSMLPRGFGCVIAGPGKADYVEGLRRHPANQTHRITFPGEVEDVDGFMAGIDVLVVPSIGFEAFGMVILEAMLHSKPVICSDFGGMKEIVVHGETGYVVPAGEAVALAEALQRLLNDRNLRLQMGNAGHHRLMDCFTAERMAEQYDALLA